MLLTDNKVMIDKNDFIDLDDGTVSKEINKNFRKGGRDSITSTLQGGKGPWTELGITTEQSSPR